MRDKIVVLLGGRVAEKLVLDDISTGASNDLERATDIARKMVTRYGFSEKLGPIVYGTPDEQVFLGRDFNSGRNYSENVAAEIDSEIRDLVEDGYQTAQDILTAHMEQLDLVAKYLIVHEKIDGATFEKLMNGEITKEDFENEQSSKKENESDDNDLGQNLDVTVDENSEVDGENKVEDSPKDDENSEE